MKKLAALGLVAVALFSQTGCKRLANNRRDAKGGVFGASPLITTTPATTFANDELTFEGLPRARVSFSTTPTDYVVTFWGLPDGVVAKVGTQTLSLDHGSGVMKIDIGAVVAKLSPKEAFDHAFRLDPKTKLEVRFSETATAVVDLPPQSVAYGLAEAFKKVADTPLTIGAPSGAKEHTVLLDELVPEALGPARTVADVDWVAVQTKLPARTGRLCTGYKAIGDKAKTDTSEKSYRVQMVDESVAVYEVRTSRLVAKKDFTAEDACPTMAWGDAKSYVGTDVKKAWLRTLRSSTP